MNDETYIGHIAEAIEKVERYINGFTCEQFSKKRRTISAKNFKIPTRNFRGVK